MLSRLWAPLRQRIVLTAVAFATLVTVGVLLTAEGLVTSEAESRLDTTCTLIAALTAERINEPLALARMDEVARAAGLAVASGGAVAVAVVDRGHKTVAVVPEGIALASPMTGWPADETAHARVALGGVAAEVRFSPVRHGDDVVGGVWVAVDRRPVEQLHGRVRRAILATGGGVLVVSAALAWLLAGRLVRPLDQLAEIAGAIGRGERGARYQGRGPEEIRTLGRRINRLAEQLEARVAELEHQLRERTRQTAQDKRLLQDIAKLDPLTQLFNRRGFELEMEKYLSLCRRSGQPMAVIMMDLDKFKAYNDTHGHAAGDTALVTVAAALKGRARASDVVARLGGDEFSILIPFTKPERAVTAAEGFVSAVVDATRDLPRLESGDQLGASAGVACFPVDGDEGTELLARADAALYRAKAAGRGLVYRASPQEPAPQA